MAAKDTDDRKQEREDEANGLDMSQAAVKKMITEARVRGYITYDQLNKVLPPEQIASEQIEDVMSMLSEMGINIVENEEGEEEPLGTTDLVESNQTKEVAVSTSTTEVLDRTDDPVRMYLREMGSVELLSREGEIAIAKRIEAGRNTMISGLCESPLTFQAITIWRDELLSEDILLRDVIDLEATFVTSEGEEGGLIVTPSVPEPSVVKGTKAEDKQELDADGDIIQSDDEDEDEDEKENMSLAAMEDVLKPRVLETLELIAKNYNRLSKLQDFRISATLNEEKKFSKKQETTYQNLRVEIMESVNSLHLHNNRIEALIDQMYGINRKIMSIDSTMVKLADLARINRREFIDEYRGYELDPGWVERITLKTGRGWTALIEKSLEKVETLRSEMAQVGQYVGVDITEFRRLVQQVQKGEKEARQAKKEM
ncbi:MAG: RNA polymerase sigma factor region1.1 domain-containing protein, partial [Paracoccaceae bacterium]|nr:RNA polymerase sigma factor region1.1 domain-containing protein [Paracoccaceae bacterium]